MAVGHSRQRSGLGGSPSAPAYIISAWPGQLINYAAAILIPFLPASVENAKTPSVAKFLPRLTPFWANTENQTDSDKSVNPDNLDGQPLQANPTPPAFSKRFSDCSEIHTALKEYGAVSNGVHQIMPKGLTSPISVYCDQTTDGGGWTVIQRRFNGSIDFNRPYNDFKYGFGSANGEQWLGLENMYRLTRQRRNKLYIVLEDWVGTVKYAKYSSFSLRGSNYRLSVGGYSGTAGDGFYLARSPYSGAGQNCQPFSARDVDRDRWDKGSCAAGRPYTAGGWWYNGCGRSVLNGPYLRPSDRTNHSGWGIAWGPFGGPDTYHLKKTKMMVRPANFRQ
ncbi:hypothetical protein Bbelb_241630 [Branchiostoma belcheri]|nr:hypothetical protein Bbelb_241630 [Branchiostoma belcheri]